MIVFEDAYLTESQRLANANFLEFDATLAKYDTLYEAVDGEFKANLSLAEAKVFRECGTEDDLVMLYEAADKDAAEKKGNIIARAFKAIADFLKKLVEGVKIAFSKNKKEEIEVPKTTAEFIKYAVGEGKALINKVINALNNMNDIVKVAAAAVPARVLADFIVKNFESKGGDEGTAMVAASDGQQAASLLGKFTAAVGNAIGKVKNAFKKMTGNESSDDKTKALSIDGLIQTISKFFGKQISIIMNALNSTSKKNNSTGNSEGNPEDSQDANTKGNTGDNTGEKSGDNQSKTGTDGGNTEKPSNGGEETPNHDEDWRVFENTSESVYDYIFDDSNYTVESQDDYSACMNYLDSLIADL